MSRELIQLDARKRPTRVSLFLLITVAALWSFYAVRWYVGNTMAEYFNTDENNLDLARTAVTFAPSDPLTHWTLGQVLLKGMPLDQMSASLPEYEKAVSLSPADYRLWTSLGIARQRVGETEKAEQAFRRAIDLAPTYNLPRWYLGNLLLRNARYDEAFNELRTASDGDPENLRPQFYNLVWQVYEDDLPSILRALGDSPGSRAEFARYQTSQHRFAEGLKVWDTLNAEQKNAASSTAGLMIKDLLGAQQFHSAARVWNEIVSTGRRVDMGQITDGDLELILSPGSEGYFDWQVKNEPGVQIGIDTGVSHAGERSLRLSFQVRSNTRSMSATELVPVATNAEYEFECYVRTENLNSGGTPIIQIVDAMNGAILASTEAAQNGTNDWNRVTASFKTSASTEAVILRIVRSPCDDNLDVCPIFGAVWYDDFNFKRNG
jgi:tetratricopeptide (TPR) repeat protein